MNDSISQKPRWFWPACVINALLLTSWLLPSTRALWKQLDDATFFLLNDSLKGNPSAQMFWAFANTRLFDISAALLLTLPFFIYIRAGNIAERIPRVAQGIGMGLIITVTMLLSKQVNLERGSPSHAFPEVDISHVLSWAEAKVFSYNAFPSDHGTATMLITVFYWHFAGRKYGLFAAVLAVFFCIPRMVSGAHWLSDVLVGSTLVTFVVVSIVLATPLEAVCIRHLKLWWHGEITE